MGIKFDRMPNALETTKKTVQPIPDVASFFDAASSVCTPYCLILFSDEFYEDDPFPYGARAYPGDGSLYRKQQALPPPYTEKDAAAHARRHARSASARASSGYPAPPSYQQSQRHSYWAGKLRSGNKRRSKMADVENQRSSYIADQQISSYMQNQPPDVVVRPEPLQQSRGSLQVTRSSVSLQGNSRESLPISSSTPSLQRTDSQKDSVVVPDNPGAVFRQSSTAPLMEN